MKKNKNKNETHICINQALEKERSMGETEPIHTHTHRIIEIEWIECGGYGNELVIGPNWPDQ